ncbi:transcriptional adapter 2-alpha [Phakopsora pachyrhizi]|uniref:Transcriptional adapter 2-alpha n=1 Tax=Phakopsora pachyrhizi TaxID=170000 RepID=A0AAV0BYB0_PHAPC|nr:transcriptional adapter 2-alpha [Phakopsora pachyrhizi]
MEPNHQQQPINNNHPNNNNNNNNNQYQYHQQPSETTLTASNQGPSSSSTATAAGLEDDRSLQNHNQQNHLNLSSINQPQPYNDQLQDSNNLPQPTPSSHQPSPALPSNQQNSSSTLNQLAVKDSSSTKNNQKLTETRKRNEEIAKQYLIAQTQPIIIPSYSAWFDLSKIHQIEQKSLPEFFNGRNRSKVPSIYKDYRDFIVNSYRLNPSEYLTVTACRRNLAGDVCAIMRVHAFLEQWGIINYQVDADTRPASVGPPFTGHFRILLDTPRGLMPLHPGTITNRNPISLSSETNLSNSNNLTQAKIQTGPNQQSHPAGLATTDLRKNIFPGSTATSAEKTIRCDVCGTDCTKLCYHHTKLRNYDVCQNCYSEARFGNQMNSSEFVRLERSDEGAGPISKGWSDREILLLLEGLEMYSDDWDRVAEHVGGTKTKEECIGEFLKLPIEDEFLKSSKDETGLGKALRNGKIPLSGAENAVLSVVSFLVGLVDPEVVAEMSGRSIKKIKNDLRSKVSKERAGTKDLVIESGESKAAEPAESTTTKEQTDQPKRDDQDSMDIDEPTREDNSESQNGKRKRREEGEAVAMALGSASSKAFILGSEDESELIGLMEKITDLTVKKIESKLRQFSRLESCLEVERARLEQWRQNLSIERINLVKEIEEFKRAKREEEEKRSSSRAFGGAIEGEGDVSVGTRLVSGETVRYMSGESIRAVRIDDSAAENLFKNHQQIPGTTPAAGNLSIG